LLEQSEADQSSEQPAVSEVNAAEIVAGVDEALLAVEGAAQK
jgi:hypothetical protein